MAKIKKRKLIWGTSISPNVISYKLYWAEEGEVNYDSPSAMLGNVTEVVLPEQVPSFPIVKGPIKLGITAVNEMGNESDMIIIEAPFHFSTPDAPRDPRLEPLKEYHFSQGANTDTEDKKPAMDITDFDCRDDLSLGKILDHLPPQRSFERENF